MYAKDGLYADIVLKHGDKEILVNDVIIDTGACQSIILTDFLSVNNIGFSVDDELVVLSGIGGAEDSAIRKKVDEIAMGDITLNDVFVDFGVIDPKDRINGLIGLDFLKGAKTIIDVGDLLIMQKTCESI